MRILFISDIHGNYPALKTIQNTIDNVDLTICLGDIVGYHCYVNEVIEFLQHNNVVCIQGNHDRYVFEGLENQTKVINDSVRFGIEQANLLLSDDNREWLRQLPTSFSFKVDDCSILCCHGSPWDVTNGYIYADSDRFAEMNQFSYNVIALGHTHREYIKEIGSQIVFNPGSVGQARDFEGQVCAKILETDSLDLETIHRPYDYLETIKDSVSRGAEEWVYKHFKTVTKNKKKYDSF